MYLTSLNPCEQLNRIIGCQIAEIDVVETLASGVLDALEIDIREAIGVDASPYSNIKTNKDLGRGSS